MAAIPRTLSASHRLHASHTQVLERSGTPFGVYLIWYGWAPVRSQSSSLTTARAACRHSVREHEHELVREGAALAGDGARREVTRVFEQELRSGLGEGGELVVACDGVDVERRGDGQERGFQLALQLELDRPHLVLRRRREDGAEIVQRAEYWAVDGVAEAEEVVHYLVLRHGYYGMRLRCPAQT